jgi:hypothetical protein
MVCMQMSTGLSFDAIHPFDPESTGVDIDILDLTVMQTVGDMEVSGYWPRTGGIPFILTLPDETLP